MGEKFLSHKDQTVALLDNAWKSEMHMITPMPENGQCRIIEKLVNS